MPELADKLAEDHKVVELPGEVCDPVIKRINELRPEVLSHSQRLELLHRVGRIQIGLKANPTEALENLSKTLQELDQHYLITMGIDVKGSFEVDPKKQLEPQLADYVRSGMEYLQTYKEAQKQGE